MRYRQRAIASLTGNGERFSDDRVTVHACNVYVRVNVRSVTSHDLDDEGYTSDTIGDQLYLFKDLMYRVIFFNLFCKIVQQEKDCF